jgi:hypothetical protein
MVNLVYDMMERKLQLEEMVKALGKDHQEMPGDD